MKAYKYKALSKSGKKVNGIIEAYNEYEAVSKIKDQNMVIEKIEEIQESKGKKFDINEPLNLSEKVLSLTANQFAILLRTGLPASRTVEVIAEQTTDKYMKRILTEVAKDVAAGYGLATSLEQHGKKIPATFIETVRAGEESGTLDKSFERLAKYYEKSYKLNSKVKSAMSYPVILCVLAVAVVIVVVKFTVPAITETIVSGGGTMPVPTQILLTVYNFFEKWGLLVLAVIAGIVIAFKAYKKTESGKMKTAQLAYKIPIIGTINVMNAASQFASSMTTLIKAGLPMTKALKITGKVMDNYAVGSSIANAATGVEEGRRLGDVLRGNRYLPALLIEMTTVGEESGALEDTLTTIGAYYDSEVEESTGKALGLLEPIIIVVMGLVIGFILISLYLPMFSSYNYY